MIAVHMGGSRDQENEGNRKIVCHIKIKSIVENDYKTFWKCKPNTRNLFTPIPMPTPMWNGKNCTWTCVWRRAVLFFVVAAAATATATLLSRFNLAGTPRLGCGVTAKCEWVLYPFVLYRFHLLPISPGLCVTSNDEKMGLKGIAHECILRMCWRTCGDGGPWLWGGEEIWR